MFKVAVVGCGGIGMAHLRAWSAIDGVEIAAVVDLSRERAEAAAAGFDCRALTDIAELQADLDGVSVVTPPAAHYPVVKALLERGFHVFSEKPLTLSVRQCEELDALAVVKNRILAVGFKMRFEPVWNAAKEQLPKIGKLVSIVTTKLQAFNPRPEGAWVTRTGAMYELSIHDFDLISYITGRLPQKVLFSKLQHRFGWEKEDAFTVAADYGDGITALLQGMYAVESTFEYRDLTMTFLGDRGYMRVERPDRIILHADTHSVIAVTDTGVNTFVSELTHFKNCVEGREVNTLTAASATAMTRLIEEARASGEN